MPRMVLRMLMWMQAEARAEEIAAFTVTPEYGKSVGFQLISGASGTGRSCSWALGIVLGLATCDC